MDRLAIALENDGYPTVRQNLKRDGRMGRLVCVGKSEICFGIEDDDRTVIIIDFRRTDERLSLRHGFRDLIWFVDYLAQRPELGLTRVRGLVRADRTPTALSNDRIAAFYYRMNATVQNVERGEQWFVLELADWKHPHRRDSKTIAVAGVLGGALDG